MSDNVIVAKLPEVCVLMSTYNGEKYLKEQINSILAQKGVCVKLFVRDDGSSDNTLDILQEYADKGLLEIVTFGGNFGPAKSFMELLYYVGDKYDYYAFADQDDIWKEEKLSVAVSMIGKADRPKLYCSNWYLYQNNNDYGLFFPDNLEFSLIHVLCFNSFAGCTMLFNRSLVTYLINPEYRPSETLLKVRMHDTWIISAASLLGEILYDKNSYILHRIHGNNTAGLPDFNKWNIKRYIEIFVLHTSKLGYGASTLARDLMKLLPFADKEQTKIIKLFADAKHNKVALIRSKQIRKEWHGNRLRFVVKVLMGWL